MTYFGKSTSKILWNVSLSKIRYTLSLVTLIIMITTLLGLGADCNLNSGLEPAITTSHKSHACKVTNVQKLLG